MKKVSLILLSLTITILIQGQQKDVMLTIDGKDITREEFLWMYNKNNSAIEELSQEAYLDSYIDFQLKIRDAEKMGLDTTAAFIKDQAAYKSQLYQSYLPQEPTLDMLVKEAYERMKSDVKASHILVRVSPGASPADTLKAWEKISDLRKRVMEGEDFALVASENSEDPSAKINGGNLNYFTALTMVYPIETVAYETIPGKISKPIRTNMGYHIVKVEDKRPAMGLVRLSHIYTSTVEQNGLPKDQKSKDEARVKIYKAYEELNAGMPFNDAVLEYTEDPGARQNGGELPVTGVGQMDPEFEEYTFRLGGPGSVSRPFETAFGWHIVMLLEKIPIGSFASEREDLERRVLSDRRPEYHHLLHIEGIKYRYGFSAFPEELEAVFSKGDSSLLIGEWEAGSLAENHTTLVKIGDLDLSIGDFAHFIERIQSRERRARDPRYYMTEIYSLFIDESVLDYEYNRVPLEHPEVVHLLQEYRDGMLLFEVSNQEVWSKALSDTAGLNRFFQQHRDQYMWKERTDAYIVTCTPGASVEKVRKKYKKIQSGSFDANKLNEKYCDNDTVACVHLARVLTEPGVYKRIDDLKGVIGPGAVYDSKVTKGFVIINEVRPPEPKELADVKGEVVSDYQGYLEEAWLEDLRKRFELVIHENTAR